MRLHGHVLVHVLHAAPATFLETGQETHTRRHGLLVPALSADMSLPACAPLGSFAKRLRARVGDEAFDSPVVCRVHGQPGCERL